MPFAVDDFQDLLRLLEQHPEWQADLRRHVLTDELLELPALVRRLTEAQTRTTEAQARTDEQLTRLTARVDALTIRLDALTARVDALTEQVIVLTARLDALIVQVAALTSRVDANTGELLELRYERRAGAYFSQMVRRVRVLNHSALADLLDDAVDQGQITDGERLEVLRADLVLTGQRRADREAVYIVAEISLGIGVDDVRRAVIRAGIMARLGRPAIPVVAGQRIDPEPADLANTRGVWQVLDGRVIPPQEAA